LPRLASPRAALTRPARASLLELSRAAAPTRQASPVPQGKLSAEGSSAQANAITEVIADYNA
jgi:hypothetical protein